MIHHCLDLFPWIRCITQNKTLIPSVCHPKSMICPSVIGDNGFRNEQFGRTVSGGTFHTASSTVLFARLRDCSWLPGAKQPSRGPRIYLGHVQAWLCSWRMHAWLSISKYIEMKNLKMKSHFPGWPTMVMNTLKLLYYVERRQQTPAKRAQATPG